MVSGVESKAVCAAADPAGASAVGIRLRMLGPLEVWRDARRVTLPASRKVRALLCWLALSPRPVARGQLCELFWEGPSDPRGELRWCLSKIRSVVDTPGRSRVQGLDDAVALDLADCFVDAIDVARELEHGVAAIDRVRQRELLALFQGEFLEGLELGRNPGFDAWLTAQRRRFRSLQAALLDRIVGQAGDDEVFGYLEQWLRLCPFEARAHRILLDTLARLGRVREGDEHMAVSARLFEAEGMDFGPVRDAWRSARGSCIEAGMESGLEPAPAPVPWRESADSIDEGVALATRRASLAVMPFHDGSAVAGAFRGVGDALVHDTITRLAKLRSLFVIADGTVFALHERGVAAHEAARLLDVDYFVGGSVGWAGDRLRVSVELVETGSARIVWSETFVRRAQDAFSVLDEISDMIVSSVAGEIETLERNRAILLPPDSLDAWEAHHRGLWHMYRFTKDDNALARHFFEVALRLDPSFSRAWAGLSFTHFQDAFQGWSSRAPGTTRALEAAAQGLLADDHDPAAHWAMGRALWLRGEHAPSVLELERAVDLSPNFALGHYTLAFVHSQAGDPLAAIASADLSRHLSPFDPLLFGMLGARAMAHVRLGQFEEAARWAVKAAARPNAHPHILAIAAFSLALAGTLGDARAQAAAIRRALPRYSFADFEEAFRFDEPGAELFREGARRIGMA
ncbi:adenylate cyclase [Quisquiliibacterium transsilvanicum]